MLINFLYFARALFITIILTSVLFSSFEQAELFYSQKKFSVAGDLLKKVIETDPVNHKAHFYLGNILTLTSNYNQADTHYSKAIELNPSFNYYYTYAMLKFNQKTYDVAEQLFLKASKIKTNVAEPHVAIAQIFIEQYQYETAVTKLSTILTNYPQYKHSENIRTLISVLTSKYAYATEMRTKLGGSGLTHSSPTGSPNQESLTDIFNINIDDLGKTEAIKTKSEDSIKEVKLNLDLID